MAKENLFFDMIFVIKIPFQKALSVLKTNPLLIFKFTFKCPIMDSKEFVGLGFNCYKLFLLPFLWKTNYGFKR